SDIPGLFDPNLPDAVTVVAELARQVRYEHFNGTLSMIAEYYLMKSAEYGRSSLVQNLLTIGASSPLMKSRTYENGRTQKKSLFAQFPGILATARNCPYS